MVEMDGTIHGTHRHMCQYLTYDLFDKIKYEIKIFQLILHQNRRYTLNMLLLELKKQELWQVWRAACFYHDFR